MKDQEDHNQITYRREQVSYYLLFLLLAATLGGYFLYLSQLRLIARDEGFYLLASQLVAEGKLLYRDFFYPQMPLLPYIYGAWGKLTGFSWQTARLLSGLLATGIGLVVFFSCRHSFGRSIGVIAALLYATCNFSFAWFATAQTYSLSVFFLVIAFALMQQFERTASICMLVMSGIALGLSIDTRLFFAGLVPAFVLHLLVLYLSKRTPALSFVFFSAGLFIGLLPALLYLAADPDLFWYNNLGYHLDRARMSAETITMKRLRIIDVVLGIVPSNRYTGFQLPLLIWAASCSVLLSLCRRCYPGLAFLIAASLFALNLIPEPPYLQYFAALVPFAAILAAQLLFFLLQLSRGRLARQLFLLIGISVFGFCYMRGFADDIYRYTQSGERVIGVETSERAKTLNVTFAAQIPAMIDSIAASGSRVAALWPGHMFGATTAVYPGLENHFGRPAAAQVESAELRRRYRLLSRKELLAVIKAGGVDLVVTPRGSIDRRLNTALAAGNFRQRHTRREVIFFKKTATSDH